VKGETNGVTVVGGPVGVAAAGTPVGVAVTGRPIGVAVTGGPAGVAVTGSPAAPGCARMTIPMRTPKKATYKTWLRGILQEPPHKLCSTAIGRSSSTSGRAVLAVKSGHGKPR
jgi:hypothetical protein